MSALHFLDDEGSRWRIVVEVNPPARRLFEAILPADATMGEIAAFGLQLAAIVAKRRASDQDITKKERPR